MVEGSQRALGPVAAGDLGDGEEGTPVVGQTVEDAWRQSRVASDQGGVIVFGPAGELAGENGFDFDVERVEAGQELALRGSHQGNEDGTVAQSGRKRADASQRGRGEGVEGADSVTIPFTAVSARAAFVAGV